MLLKHHRNYTNEALEGLAIPEEIKNEIVIGVCANDLCALTNDYNIIINTKDDIYKIFNSNRSFSSMLYAIDDSEKDLFFFNKLFKGFAIWQSHFGKLTSLHCMSKYHGESPNDLLNDLILWFDFLNQIALDKISIKPSDSIKDIGLPISTMFEGTKIDLEDILDTEELNLIKYRVVGMMLHFIQDSFTISHCERDSDNKIKKFYCYDSQDKEKHNINDDVSDNNREFLIEECSRCVKDIFIDNRKYEYNNVFSLSNDAKPSDGGPFV